MASRQRPVGRTAAAGACPCGANLTLFSLPSQDYTLTILLDRSRHPRLPDLSVLRDPVPALQATNLARWRTRLAQHTSLSPHTFKRLLAAMKRLVQEAAAQGAVSGG